MEEIKLGDTTEVKSYLKCTITILPFCTQSKYPSYIKISSVFDILWYC